MKHCISWSYLKVINGFSYYFYAQMFRFHRQYLHSLCSCCRLFKVNGEPIFIRGGNWIVSDGLLRLTEERYKSDIDFHADMNFNMIRCWGGGITERPEFYQNCDRRGLLVIFIHKLLLYQNSIHFILLIGKFFENANMREKMK